MVVRYDSNATPVLPPKCPQNEGAREKGQRRFAVTPYVSMCRRQDLNLHDLDGHQALNLV
jgi:hypothetical protein